MIVLDTNILSEALKPSPEEAVLRWLSEQDRDVVFTTAVTQAEILYGIEMLPPGKRRSRLHAAVEQLFKDEFHGRILPFDAGSALVYPKIVAGRMRVGRPISQFDAVIASVCRSRDAMIATRNASDFEGCGLAIVNPWNEH
jgi:predicted nucleic acid-binding protein